MASNLTKIMSGNRTEIFEYVANAIHRVTSLPVSIWVPENDGKTLVIAASVGLPESYVQTAFLDLKKTSATGDAFISNKPQKILDISSDRRWKYKEHAREMNWKSAICVPIQEDGKAIGVISVYAYTQRSIPELINILPDFAKQISLTLEVAKQKEILEEILNINEKLQLMTENPKIILDLIVKAACELTGASCAVAYPFDTEHGEFYDIENVASHGLLKTLKLTKKLRSKGGMTSYIKRRGEVVLANIEKQDLTMLKTSAFIKREKICGFMGIALKVANDTLGVLYVNYREPHIFSKQEKSTIRLFSHQASNALHNARLYQQAGKQISALEKLHEAGSALTSIPNKPESLRNFLTRIAQSAQQVLGADLVDIYQYFQSQDRYDLPPIQIGKRYDEFVIKDTIHKDDVIWKIVQGRQPTYTPDAQKNKVLTSPFTVKRRDGPDSRFVIRENIKSTAAIPLIVGKEILGVVFANYRSDQFFLPEQRKLIELFASQAAIAIYNSRLYDESLLRSRRLDLVRQVAAAVSSTTDTKKILQLVVDGLAKVFDVKQSAVALFDDAGKYAIVQVEYLEPDCVSAMGHKIPLKNNPQIDKILETKNPLIVNDVQNDPIMAHTRKIMAKRGTLSLMVVPIVIDNKVVGTIGVDAIGQKRHFTGEEAELAQAIANQAATALRIARKFDDRLKDIQALQDITEQMHKGDLDAVLNLIAERAVDITNANHGGVWLVNKARTALAFGGHSKKEKYKKLPPDIPLGENSEKSFSKWVVLNGKSYISGNVRKDKNYKPWYEDTVSELTVPISYQGRVIGTINVESSKGNSFSEEHKRLLEAMAGQAASVVQNARLIERLNALDNIGIELTSGIRLKEEEILESIHNQVKRLTDTKDMYIALFEENTKKIRFALATQNGKRVEIKSRTADMTERGMTEDIIFTKKSILHKTKKDSLEWYKRPGHKEFYGEVALSWLGVPMIVGKRVQGVIAIWDWEHEGTYDDQDLQVFSSLASQAAIALDNANLYYDVNQKLERRVQALATLNDIGNILTSRIRLKEENILDLIFVQAQKLTRAQDLYIALYDDGTGEIRFPLATEKGERIPYASRMANMERRGKTDEIIFTRKFILHKTMMEAEEWYSQLGHAEFVGHITPSWLGVPMMIGERILGVIAAVDEKEYAYDELDLEVLSSMASQAAIAIQNARLYEDARGEVIAVKQLATLGTAIAALQHRINNTLNIIIPNIKRLRSRIDVTDATIKEILDIIERNTRYTSDILLRIQTPLQEVESSSVNVNSLLSEVSEKAKKEWRKKAVRTRVKIKLNLDDSIPLTQLPVGQVSEIVRNLIDNSYRAMKKGGKLLITSKLEKNTITIRLMDTAKGGIPPAVQERLFKKPVPSKEPGHGAGLGLWLSKLMLQGVGGDVTIEETGPTGTTMLIQIPVSAPGKEATV